MKKEKSKIESLDESSCQTFDDMLNFSQYGDEDPPNNSGNISVQKGCWEEYSWVACAFASAFSYTTFNTVTASFIKEDVYSAKVINCMVLGVAALTFRAYKMIFTKQESVKPDQIKAIWLSVLCGALNFIGQLALTMALNEAIQSNSNIGVVSTLLTGAMVFSLYASYFIYNEPITIV